MRILAFISRLFAARRRRIAEEDYIMTHYDNGE